MKNPSNSEQALEDYFNDLLGELVVSEPVVREPVVRETMVREPVAQTALKGIEIAPLQMSSEEPVGVRPTARLAHLSTRLTTNSGTNSSTGSGTGSNINSSFNSPYSSSAINARDAREGFKESPKERDIFRDNSGQAATPLPLRAYAEPLKTLNLRMPLPPIAAPASVEIPTLVVAPPAPLPAAEKPPAPPIAVTPVIVAPVEVATEFASDLALLPGEPAAWLDNGRPAWAQQPFECLLFSVGGLALAAPLAELGSIYPLDMELLTGIFGQAPWFMGLLSVKGSNVRTIDAAQVVMPERYVASMREQYRYVITLHGSDWGLAVDSVADSVVLQPDDIRWRGQRSKRPWLAGTVVNQMCALLDVAQLIWMFQNQDGKRAAPRLS